MTGGSAAGALLVLAWSQVESLAAFYAVWIAIGVVMAMVLYEVAFTVLAKAFPKPGERRGAMTAMTLVAALASFIFLPLAQALIDSYGWMARCSRRARRDPRRDDRPAARDRPRACTGADAGRDAARRSGRARRAGVALVAVLAAV